MERLRRPASDVQQANTAEVRDSTSLLETARWATSAQLGRVRQPLPNSFARLGIIALRLLCSKSCAIQERLHLLLERELAIDAPVGTFARNMVSKHFVRPDSTALLTRTLCVRMKTHVRVLVKIGR